MTPPDHMEKTTFRYQALAIARDVTAISATAVVLASVFWYLAKPRLEPWLELPEEIAKINARIAPISAPQLVEFRGTPQIVDAEVPHKPGDTLRIVYDLRRNADCQTDIEISWYNVRTGSRVTTSIDRAVQAPVTDDFTPFILSRLIPITLPDGFYAYYPRITPVNCGLYRSYNGPLSEVFEVRRAE